MDLGSFTRGNAERNAEQSGDGFPGRRSDCVEVELPDSSGLTSGELVKLILQADSARRQLDGYLTSLLAQLGDREGKDAVEELCRQFGLGRHRARQQAKTANILNALPATMDVAKQGWISIDHARVMGESHQRAPLSTEDAADADTECEIAPQATTLVVTVDYDTLSGQLRNAGLIDGTPIDIDELRHLACDAGIVPAIFAADGQPLYMGRKQRAATAAQKLALHVRDKQCIGCGIRASACDAHHIIWWDNEGPTDMPNLVLLCPKCHKKVHKHGYTLAEDPARPCRLRPPPAAAKARSPDNRTEPRRDANAGRLSFAQAQ